MLIKDFLILLFFLHEHNCMGENDLMREKYSSDSPSEKRHLKLRLPDPKTVVTKPNQFVSLGSSCSDFDRSPVVRIKNSREESLPSKPFWAPAYPGSGSEMFRIVVKAITGGAYRGEDVYSRWCHKGSVITCKTHFPTHVLGNGELHPLDDKRHNPASEKFQPNIMFLIRNPSRALASYANYIYETKNRDKISPHSTQMPESQWLRWRDEYFLREIRVWCDQIIYWLSITRHHFYYGSIKFIQFEKMLDPGTGPTLMQEVSDIITLEGGIDVIPAEAIPCAWYRSVVQQHNFFAGNSKNDRDGSGKIELGYTKRVSNYVPSYSKEQKNVINTSLVNLCNVISSKYPEEEELYEILQYYQTINST